MPSVCGNKWDEKVKGEEKVAKLCLVVDVVDSLLSEQYFSYESMWYKARLCCDIV